MKASPNKIALTVDVEDWFHTPAVTGSDFSTYSDVPTFMKSWKGQYDYITDATIDLLATFKELNLKATFFIVADILEYYPKIVEAILKDGHEIGCHGLHHAINIDSRTKLPVFPRPEFEERTGTARQMLQKFTGQKISGYRAPGAYIGEWMFESLNNLGFTYDSSVNPNSFFNKTDFDTRDIPSTPYVIDFKSGGKLVELPWPYFNFAGFRFPTAGGPFLRFFPTKYTTTGLAASLKRGHSVFYFHSIDIAKEKLPSLASNNSRRPGYFMTSGHTTKKKLVKILKKFHSSWTTCQEIVETVKT